VNCTNNEDALGINKNNNIAGLKQALLMISKELLELQFQFAALHINIAIIEIECELETRHSE
jgi:hypothetical protein